MLGTTSGARVGARKVRGVRWDRLLLVLLTLLTWVAIGYLATHVI